MKLRRKTIRNNRRKARGGPKPEMPPIVTALVLILCAVYLMLLSLYLQPGTSAEALQSLLKQPLLLLLNLLPSLAFLAALYFLFRSVFFSAAAGTVVFGLLSLVSTLKTELRSEPLFPADVSPMSETFRTVLKSLPNGHWGDLIVLAASLLLFVLLGIFIKSAYPKKISVRLCCFLLTLVVFAVGVWKIYGSKTLYHGFQSGTNDSVTAEYSETGFSYSFLHFFDL